MLKSKTLYKIEVYLLKIIPMILALCCFINTLLSYFYIDVTIITYIASVGILPLLFLYVSSYVFRFCEYHRMFLHYIVINNILCFIDYKYNIPINNKEYLILHLLIVFIILLLILYLKFNICTKD